MAGLAACGTSAGDDPPEVASHQDEPGEIATISVGQDSPAPGVDVDRSAVEEPLRPREDDTPLSTLPFDPTAPGGKEGPPPLSLNVTCPNFEGFTWHDEVATTGADIAWGVAASCGAAYQVGYTTGTLLGEVYSGMNDAFIRRLGPDGHLVWDLQIGTSGNDHATAVAVSSTQCTPGNPIAIYVTGYTSGAIETGQYKGSSDAFLIKLNEDGTEAWRRQIGTPGVEQAWSVAYAADGSVYVAGSTAGNLAGVIPAPPSGTTSLFLSKFNAAGGLVWTRQLGVNNKTTVARGVAVGNNGQIYLTGYTTAGLAGQPYSGGSADAFVASYSAAGVLGQVVLLGTTAQDQAFSLTTGVEASQTVVYVAGYTNGNFPTYASSSAYDAFLVKLNANLNTQWLRQTTASQNVSGNAVVLVNGSVLLVGSTTRDLDSDAALGSSDIYLRKYDSAGTHVHTEYVGTNAKETAQGAAADTDGNITLTGWTDANFCGHPFGGGGADAVTVRVLGGCLVEHPDPSCKVGAGSGDPHYLNFRNKAFDFQASGVFVLAGNTDDPDFQVQVRQCPWWPGAAVATARAVGARVRGDVVEVHENSSVYVNTTLTPLPPTGAVPLPGGGSVYRASGGRIVVAWPGGERLVTHPFNVYMNVVMLVPASRQGKMLGILGNADAVTGNQFMMARDGSDLRTNLTFFEMYRDVVSFASVWRVDAAQGDVPLIAHGTPCDDPDAPAAPTWLNNLTPAQQAAGETACNGIVDDVLHQTCILDVGLTGETAFAQSTQEIADTLVNQGQIGPIENSPRSVYFNNFSGAIGPEWESIVTSVTPLGDRTFLGQFGNETVPLTLNNLGPHTELTVSFDLYLINDWDGIGPFGPNVLSASVDGQEIFSASFSNTFSDQSYPLDGSPAGTGALEVDTLFYPYGDSVYRMKLVFPHTAPDLSLDLSASGLTGLFGEAWGVANFEVQGL